MLKRLSREKKGLFSYLICLGFSIIAIAIFSLIMGIVAALGEDPTRSIDIFSLISLMISALVSGIFTSRFCGEEGVIMSFLTSLSVAVIMFIFGTIWGINSIFSTVMNYLCYVGVFALSALMARKRNRHRRH